MIIMMRYMIKSKKLKVLKFKKEVKRPKNQIIHINLMKYNRKRM